jgi:hypothetical protein
VFRSVVHLDPVEQIFLDPVTAHVGISLVDARDGLNDIEPFAIGPDELAFPGVELHVLHHLAEGVGALGKLLALRRMPPCQEVVEKGIAGKDIVLPLLRKLVAPFAHENFHRLAPSRGSTRVALATRQLALVNPEGAVKARKRAPAASRRQSAGSIARRASLPIMRPGMVNGL